MVPALTAVLRTQRGPMSKALSTAVLSTFSISAEHSYCRPELVYSKCYEITGGPFKHRLFYKV